MVTFILFPRDFLKGRFPFVIRTARNPKLNFDAGV
jgi:hypothetical protein